MIKRFRYGVYAVICYQEAVLLTKTQIGTRFIYNFPGGAVEFGEAPAKALERELEEELNLITGVIGKPLFTTRDFYSTPEEPYEQRIHTYYAVSIPDGLESISEGDVLGLKWVKIADLPASVVMLPVDEEFCHFYKEYRQKLALTALKQNV